MWYFLNSSLGLLLMGFTLTGIVGALLNWLIQSKLWERQKSHEILVKTLDEGQHLFELLTTLMSQRLYGLQKVVWAIEQGASIEVIDKLWSEYYETVQVWNEKLRYLRFKIEAIAGVPLADDFLSLRSEAEMSSPKSVHYRIRQTHMLVKSLKENYDGRKPQEGMVEAAASLNDLQGDTEQFAHQVADALLFSKKTLRQQVF